MKRLRELLNLYKEINAFGKPQNKMIVKQQQQRMS